MHQTRDGMEAGHSRKNGVVENSRQSKVDMADHMAEMIAGLKPQRVAGLVCVDDNLETKCNRLCEPNNRWGSVLQKYIDLMFTKAHLGSACFAFLSFELGTDLSFFIQCSSQRFWSILFAKWFQNSTQVFFLFFFNLQHWNKPSTCFTQLKD